MPAAPVREPVVRISAPMPEGYVFVPKGNVYVTAKCRKQTQAAERTVYVVLDKNKRTVGLRVPAFVRDTVAGLEAATREDRASAVQKHDASLELKFRRAVKKLFPEAPDGAVPKVVARAMEKRSGRVGRSSKIDIEQKAKMAVVAHIRHCHTDYDKQLRQGGGRWEVRDEIRDQVNEILDSWRGNALPPIHVPPRHKKGRSSKAASSRTEQRVQKKDTAHTPHAPSSKPLAHGLSRGQRRARKKAIREAWEWENSTKTTVTLRSGRNLADEWNNRPKSPPSPKELQMTKLSASEPRRISTMAPDAQWLSMDSIGQSLRDDVLDLQESDEYGGAGKDKAIWISSDDSD